MAVAAPSRTAAARRIRPLPSARLALTLAALAGLTLGAAYMHTRALGAALWMDEANSIGIAKHPLSAMPGLLRHDGSPPFYYLLLKLWMAPFGSSERATHAMSVLFAVLAVPVGWWSGRRLFGPAAGWVAAVLLAINPLLGTYAEETRMYSLAGLLGLVTATAFVLAFVHRDRRWAIGFALSLAALAYTHNWGLFVGAACALVVLGMLAVGPRRRELLTLAAIGFGGALLLYAPWIPTLVRQVGHTGAPWMNAPRPIALTHAPLKIVGPLEAALIGAGVLVAGAAIAAWRRRRLELTALAALVALAALTMGIGYLASQSHPAFIARYFLVIVGPLLLAAAGAAASCGVPGLIAAAIVAVLWAQVPVTKEVERKSNVAAWSREASRRVCRGDLVLSTQPEQVPALAYYLRPRLRYATPLGTVPDPKVVDWNDALARLRQPQAAARVRTLVAGAAPGTRILLAVPNFHTGSWSAPWTRRVRVLTHVWRAALSRDLLVRRLASLPAGSRGKRSTVEGAVYLRLGRGTTRTAVPRTRSFASRSARTPPCV